MATNDIEGLESMHSEGERTALLLSSLSSRAPFSGRRHAVAGRCFTFTTVFCALSFPLLGACILVLGVLITGWSDDAHVAGGAYVGGGTAEIALGGCLVLRLLLKLCKLSRTSGGETANCLLFVALTFSFMVWCAVVFSLCVAVILNGLNYGGDWRETTAMALSGASLLLVLVFGGSVCCWAGCPAD